MWTGSTQKQQHWVSEGTVVESEQGWFELALYNLSNLFLMLTVQYSLYLTLVKRCVKKKIVHLLFESERGNNRQRAVGFFLPQRVTRGPVCYSAIYQKHLFLQYFVDPRPQHF